MRLGLFRSSGAPAMDQEAVCEMVYASGYALVPDGMGTT